ncbi:MAG: 2-phosphosulfolactate phosphatase [Sphingobacteriales bacterium]|jgi:2-phosphosulfolactate phosphatase
MKPTIHTVLSPALLNLYDVSDSIVVIIDVLRATSTIATALFNGAAAVIPVATVQRCIELGNEYGGVTAGERDGKVAEGLTYGNSPFEYPEAFIRDKILVLTTTNGTKLLHMALDNGAKEIITGSFPNLSAVVNHLRKQNRNVILGCSAWKNRVNIEDTLFAGAVIEQLYDEFNIMCDSSHVALNLYKSAKPDLFGFMKANNATHYHRLTNFGLDKDMQYCLTADGANVLPVFVGDRLVRSVN